MKHQTELTVLELDELDHIVGGGWKGKLFKGIVKVGRKVGEGISDGIKAIGKWGTVAGATEAGSRGVESATGGKVRAPRPSDALK